MVRWPGKIAPGQVCNGIVSHLDWLPTLLAAAGEPDIKNKLLNGHQVGNKNFKIHLDGYNMLDYWTGKTDKNPRKEFFYFSDDGDITGLRYDNWKIVFMEQRLKGTMGVWAEPFVKLRLAKFFNLRTDPYEFADITSNEYYKWLIYHAYILYGAMTIAQKFAATFKDFPIIQKPNTFGIDDAIRAMEDTVGGASH